MLPERFETEIPVVDLGPAASLMDAFRASGCHRVEAEGFAPFGWVDVDAFRRNTGLISKGFEVQAFIGMSQAYLIGSRDDDPASEPPVDPEAEYEDEDDED